MIDTITYTHSLFQSTSITVIYLHYPTCTWIGQYSSQSPRLLSVQLPMVDFTATAKTQATDPLIFALQSSPSSPRNGHRNDRSYPTG